MSKENGFIAYYNIFLMMLLISSLIFVKFEDNFNEVLGITYFNKLNDYVDMENALYVKSFHIATGDYSLKYKYVESYRRGVTIYEKTIDSETNYYRFTTNISNGYFDGYFDMKFDYYYVDGVMSIDSWKTSFILFNGYPRRGDIE